MNVQLWIICSRGRLLFSSHHLVPQSSRGYADIGDHESLSAEIPLVRGRYTVGSKSANDDIGMCENDCINTGIHILGSYILFIEL